MIALLKRFWMYFAHTIKLSSNGDTVTVTCSCGWMCRADGKEKWSDASHATEIHLGNIKRRGLSSLQEKRFRADRDDCRA